MQAAKLKELEKVIQRGLASFIEVGNALLEIRESGLYKLHYRSFEEYCLERWGLSKSYAHRQIIAAQTADQLQRALETAGQDGKVVPIGTTSPIQNEHQARQVRGKLPFVVERVKAGERPEDAVQAVIQEREREKRAEADASPPQRQQVVKLKRGRPRDTTDDTAALNVQVQQWLQQGWRLLSDQNGVELLPRHTDLTKKLVALLVEHGWAGDA